MVASDIWFNETHTFWKRPDPDVNPEDIQTEVFLLPAAGSFEKEGSISNSGRWVQWRYKAVEAPEQAMSDLDMMIRLFKRIRQLYEREGGALPRSHTQPGLGLQRRGRGGRHRPGDERLRR